MMLFEIKKKKKKLNLVQFDQFIFTHLNVLYFEFIGDIDNGWWNGEKVGEVAYSRW